MTVQHDIKISWATTSVVEKLVEPSYLPQDAKKGDEASGRV